MGQHMVVMVSFPPHVCPAGDHFNNFLFSNLINDYYLLSPSAVGTILQVANQVKSNVMSSCDHFSVRGDTDHDPLRRLSDDTIPISSIEFDYKPAAPQIRGRNSWGVGNLYENMAKQMAAFLDTGLLSNKQSRHPKMVDVAMTNKTHVDILPGGDGDTLLNLDRVRKVKTVSNSININDMESHGGGGGNAKPLVSSPNQTIKESGWSPLIVSDSLPTQGDVYSGREKLLKRKLNTSWKRLDSRRKE